MDFEKILETDTLNQGRVKINNIGEAVKGQVSEIKSDLVESESMIVNDYDRTFTDTLQSAGYYYANLSIPKGFTISITNRSTFEITVNIIGLNETLSKGALKSNDTITFVAPFFIKSIKSFCTGTDVNIHVVAKNPQNDNIEKNNENIADIGETIKSLNNGVDITVSDTIETVGNYSYSVNIPNGFECIFTNTSKHVCTLNVSDGVSETNISNSVNPNTKCEFVAPFNIKKIRCWFNDTNISFKLKAYTKAESLNKVIGNELKGFLYISNNGDINIDVDGAYVNIKIKSDSLTYRNPSFSNVVSADDIVSSIDGATYKDGVISLRIPPTKYLIYDIGKNKLLMTDITFVDNSIILVKNWYGNIAGYWIELYGYRQAHIKSIENLESRIFNSPPMYMLTDEEVKTKSKEYSSLFANVSAKTEQFLFMTDAHYYNDNLDARENAQKYIATISKIYHSTPTSYVLDGGDWIGHFDNVNDYCYTMGLIKGECDYLLSPHYFALGNHDTNYQSSSGEIQKSVQKALLFSDKQNTYYSFVGDNTKWYVLDSGIDSDANTNLRPFDLEQIIWLCSELKDNTSKNIALMVHMVWNGGDNRTVLSAELEKIIVAFNSKTNYTHNDITYDFSNSKGKVKFVLCGHSHTDKNTLFGNVPVVCTTTARADFKATFDLCLADYGANKLYMIRVGSGENREFTIPSD